MLATVRKRKARDAGQKVVPRRAQKANDTSSLIVAHELAGLDGAQHDALASRRFPAVNLVDCRIHNLFFSRLLRRKLFHDLALP